MKLLIGDEFTKLAVNTTQGKMTLPQDFSGSWFVFFSHPADLTPVCTTEFVAFQKRTEEFKKLNTKLIGLSVDSVEEHHNWLNWIKENLHVEIEFPVIEDLDRNISVALGMLRENQKDTVTARSVVIVDDKGIVRTILEYPKEFGRNLDEVVRIIKGLQMFETKKVFAPANWPHNELIGDKVLVAASPRITEEVIKEEGIQKLSDWFMCKNLK